MHAKKGRPVYAVGDGTVWISRADTGGYGVGGKPGGCIIIVHRTGAGEEFRALYGHVSKLAVKEGDRVVPGQLIAVNGLDHLHFGIHPGETYRDRNPYAGEVPKKWEDHGGWVDPVKYLARIRAGRATRRRRCPSSGSRRMWLRPTSAPPPASPTGRSRTGRRRAPSHRICLAGDAAAAGGRRSAAAVRCRQIRGERSSPRRPSASPCATDCRC